MSTPTITANMESETSITEAKHLAVASGKSLRRWAGDVIEAELKRVRASHLVGPNLSSAPKRTLRGKR